MHAEQIARVCHEVNRAYCQALGDTSQAMWEESPDWQRQSAINGVVFHQNNPGAGPSASHENWMREKLAAGWTYGPVKDPEKKQHPCLVPYAELPQAQQAKDAIFVAIVLQLSETLPVIEAVPDPTPNPTPVAPDALPPGQRPLVEVMRTILPRWRSHKCVHAAKIVAMVDVSDSEPVPMEFGSRLILEDLRSTTDRIYVDVPGAYLARHQPQVDGYYVVYDDGYESFSPAAAFESGYTLVVPEPPALPAPADAPAIKPHGDETHPPHRWGV